MTLRRRKRTTYEWVCTCERCGYSWTSLGDEAPERCPGCKARGWQKPARPYRLKISKA